MLKIRISRIAYAIALVQGEKLHDPNNRLRFKSTRQQISDWLDEQPGCVLVIDELNKAMTGDRQGVECAQFLRDNFLKPMNRFLVISSHWYSPLLVKHMSWPATDQDG